MVSSFLFALLLLVAASSVAVESTCSDRTCGSTTVFYPFGFSAGCPILLNCSAFGEVRLGNFRVRNVTASSLILDMPASCNRSTDDAAALFSKNFAVMASNALFLGGCSGNVTTECSISPDIISQRLNQTSCGRGLGDIRCYSNGGTEELYSEEIFTPIAKQCRVLFTSSRYGRDASNQSTLVFESAEVGWWLRGNCRCAANAACSRIDLSDRNGTARYRCSCNQGFTGDGFADGVGCARGSKFTSSDHSDKKGHINVGDLMGGIGVGILAGSCLAVCVVVLSVKLIRKL